MSPLRYLLPALAAFSAVHAQNNDECSDEATRTIENPSDATALAACETFEGSIALATGVAGEFSLPSVQRITGDLVAENNDDLVTLSADSLASIGGEFRLSNVTQLNTLSFPQLNEVDSIKWVSMANLRELRFTTKVTSANKVEIQDTQFNTLEGIDVESVETFIVSQNVYLRTITVQVANVSDTLDISDNSPEAIISLPRLEWASNVNLRGAAGIDIQSLERVNNSLQFDAGTFENLAAANLTNVGDLLFTNNSALTNASFPVLEELSGGLRGQDNEAIQEWSFPAVKSVGGAVDFSGNFTSVDLPALESVLGGFNLQSTADLNSTCERFDSMHGSGQAIQGSYTCSGTVEDPGQLGDDPGNSNGDGEGAASRIGLSSIAGLTIAAMYALL